MAGPTTPSTARPWASWKLAYGGLGGGAEFAVHGDVEPFLQAAHRAAAREAPGGVYAAGGVGAGEQRVALPTRAAAARVADLRLRQRGGGRGQLGQAVEAERVPGGGARDAVDRKPVACLEAGAERSRCAGPNSPSTATPSAACRRRTACISAAAATCSACARASAATLSACATSTSAGVGAAVAPWASPAPWPSAPPWVSTAPSPGPVPSAGAKVPPEPSSSTGAWTPPGTSGSGGGSFRRFRQRLLLRRRRRPQGRPCPRRPCPSRHSKRRGRLHSLRPPSPQSFHRPHQWQGRRSRARFRSRPRAQVRGLRRRGRAARRRRRAPGAPGRRARGRWRGRRRRRRRARGRPGSGARQPRCGAVDAVGADPERALQQAHLAAFASRRSSTMWCVVVVDGRFGLRRARRRRGEAAPGLQQRGGGRGASARRARPSERRRAREEAGTKRSCAARRRARERPSESSHGSCAERSRPLRGGRRSARRARPERASRASRRAPGRPSGQRPDGGGHGSVQARPPRARGWRGHGRIPTWAQHVLSDLTWAPTGLAVGLAHCATPQTVAIRPRSPDGPHWVPRSPSS